MLNRENRGLTAKFVITFTPCPSCALAKRNNSMSHASRHVGAHAQNSGGSQEGSEETGRKEEKKNKAKSSPDRRYPLTPATEAQSIAADLRK